MLLNENERGSSTGTLMPHSGQASFDEYSRSSPPTTATCTSPLASFIANSTDCRQAMLDSRLHQQPVDHQLDGVVLALVQLDLVVGDVAQLAVDAGAREALLRQLVELLLELAFAPANDGRQHHHPVLGLQVHHLLHDLVGRLPRDRLAHIAGNAARRWRNTAGAGSRKSR